MRGFAFSKKFTGYEDGAVIYWLDNGDNALLADLPHVLNCNSVNTQGFWGGIGLRQDLPGKRVEQISSCLVEEPNLESVKFDPKKPVYFFAWYDLIDSFADLFTIAKKDGLNNLYYLGHEGEYVEVEAKYADMIITEVCEGQDPDRSFLLSANAESYFRQEFGCGRVVDLNEVPDFYMVFALDALSALGVSD